MGFDDRRVVWLAPIALFSLTFAIAKPLLSIWFVKREATAWAFAAAIAVIVIPFLTTLAIDLIRARIKSDKDDGN